MIEGAGCNAKQDDIHIELNKGAFPRWTHIQFKWSFLFYWTVLNKPFGLSSLVVVLLLILNLSIHSINQSNWSSIYPSPYGARTGCTCPYELGIISESICNLSMALLHSNNWDPTSLRSKLGDMVPDPKCLPDDVPFAEGTYLTVDIQVDSRGTSDVYIDDTTSLCVDYEGSDNVERLSHCSLLAINVASRDLHENEPIPRVDMAEIKKLLAEAGPEEIKIILGWIFNFRELTVSLPENK